MSEIWKRIVAVIAAFSGAITRVLFGYFGIKKDDEKMEKIRRICAIVFKGSAYGTTDYILTGLTASLVTFLKYNNVSEMNIFFILWTIGVIISTVLIKIDQNALHDFTLSKALRDSISATYVESKTLGIFVLVLSLIKIVFWDGPERVVMFFGEEISGRRKIELVVVILFSGIQMGAWTALYAAGYDSATDFLKNAF